VAVKEIYQMAFELAGKLFQYIHVAVKESGADDVSSAYWFQYIHVAVKEKAMQLNTF